MESKRAGAGGLAVEWQPGRPVETACSSVCQRSVAPPGTNSGPIIFILCLALRRACIPKCEYSPPVVPARPYLH